VRLKKDALKARVKGAIEIEFTEEPLSAYAGLELCGRSLRRSGWLARIRDVTFELLRYDIPYTVVGGMRFYERAEIKDGACRSWRGCASSPRQRRHARRDPQRARAISPPPCGMARFGD
jgi:hypothetical protein